MITRRMYVTLRCVHVYEKKVFLLIFDCSITFTRYPHKTPVGTLRRAHTTCLLFFIKTFAVDDINFRRL